MAHPSFDNHCDCGYSNCPSCRSYNGDYDPCDYCGDMVDYRTLTVCEALDTFACGKAECQAAQVREDVAYSEYLFGGIREDSPSIEFGMSYRD